MIYHNLAEIFAAIDESRRRLGERVSGLSPAQESFRPASDAWSIAEIVEHLSIIEERLCGLTNLMLKQAGAAGARRVGDDLSIKPFSLDAFIERSMGEKYQAPEMARARGGVPVAESLAMMERTRASLRDLRPRLEATDLSSVTYPHPIFGPINLYQWLAFIGVHEDRHLRQIESLMSLPEWQLNNE